MTIFLYGPSGSGKSSVGRELAQALNLPFKDLDVEIEAEIGKPLSEMITEQGEVAFRDVETNVLRRLINGKEKVVALGGGSLMRSENRCLVESSGQVVFLETDLLTLKKRLSKDRQIRPLLAGDLGANLVALLENRKNHYDSFDVRANASQSTQKVAREIQLILGRYLLKSMGREYEVIIEDEGFDKLGQRLKVLGFVDPVLVVSDSNVAPLYGKRVSDSLQSAGYTTTQLVISAGEQSKTIETISEIWNGCIEAGLNRTSCLLALGGGVVSDITGFAAATFMRGCQWVAVPTTLLGMVDASLGGKTGFDLPVGKNLIGAFYPPGLVLAYIKTLQTLPERELRAGFAEIVKHGVIADPKLFDLCAQQENLTISNLPQLVRRGMAVKISLIESDPFEKGVRAALNYGHTIGHAVELVSKFSILHGEAVSIGMALEARLAEQLSIAHKGLSEPIINTLTGLGLPVEIPENISPTEIIQTMKVDKKNTDGNICFSLPVKIGKVEVGVEVKDTELIFKELT